MEKKKIVIISAVVIAVILIIVGVIVYKSSNNDEKTDKKTDGSDGQDEILVLDSEYYSRDISTDVPKSKEGRTLEKVKVEIETETLSKTSGTLKIVDENEKTYEWGPGYRIQVKEGEEWKNVSTLEERVAFPNVKYTLDENGQIEEFLNWIDIYGELKEGTYRIAKPLNDNGYLEAYSNEFVIDNNVAKAQEVPAEQQTPEEQTPEEQTTPQEVESGENNV